MTSFFYYSRLSSTQLDRWQAPKQRPIIDQCPVEQTAFQREIKDLVTMDINPSLQNSWLVRQRHRSCIKELGKSPQKEWTRSLLAVPFVRGHPTVTPGTPRNDGMYTHQSPWWHATCGVFTSLPAKTHKNRNACIDALRLRVFTRHPTRTG